MGKIYAIPLSSPYLRTLSHGLISRFSEAERPYVTVLLPSERGAFSLQNVFTKQFGSHVLPKIQTLSTFCKNDIETIPSLERAHFVIEALKRCFKNQRIDQLQKMAQEITQLWDEVILSGKTYDDILKLPSSSEIQEIFKLITYGYTQYQKNQNKIDPHQCNVLSLQKKQIFSAPTILAATTATVPAVRFFSKQLLESDYGIVVLPGLKDSTCEYPVYHPLHTQSLWMNALEVYHENIPNWTEPATVFPFVNNLFDNTITSDEQRHILDFDVASNQEEALLVSLLVRHHLHLDHDIAIVCNDQKLSHMIQNHLARYQFLANQPLAQKLSNTVCGKFFLHFLNFCQKRDLQSGIAFLKHPLFFNHKERWEHLLKISIFEKDIQYEDAKTLDRFFKTFIDLPHFDAKLQKSPKEWLDKSAEYLNKISGDKAFQDVDGTALFDFLKKLSLLSFQKMQFKTWIYWIQAYMNFAPHVQEGENLHQKVVLVGTLEARNLTHDVVIVCNLNEDQWPSISAPSLWLTPDSRRNLNLPEIDRKIGLAAYDFATCIKADHVYLTRSLKQDGTQTHPNRWLQRLRLKTHHHQHAKKCFFENILKIINNPETTTIQTEYVIPSPLPQPEKFSISALELLNQDPYAYYLRYILKLQEPTPWYLGFTPAHLGQIIHKILEKMDFNAPLNMQSVDPLSLPAHRSIFVEHQIQSILTYVYENIDRRLQMDREKKLFLTLEDGTIIYGIADRIDFDHTGPIRLVDYKTGTPPPFTSIKNGYSLQMPLLACMLTQNKLANESTEYWHLKGYKNQSKIIKLPLDQDILDQALSIVRQLIDFYFTKLTK